MRDAAAAAAVPAELAASHLLCLFLSPAQTQRLLCSVGEGGRGAVGDRWMSAGSDNREKKTIFSISERDEDKSRGLEKQRRRFQKVKILFFLISASGEFTLGPLGESKLS